MQLTLHVKPQACTQTSQTVLSRCRTTRAKMETKQNESTPVFSGRLFTDTRLGRRWHLFTSTPDLTGACWVMGREGSTVQKRREHRSFPLSLFLFFSFFSSPPRKNNFFCVFFFFLGGGSDRKWISCFGYPFVVYVNFQDALFCVHEQARYYMFQRTTA